MSVAAAEPFDAKGKEPCSLCGLLTDRPDGMCAYCHREALAENLLYWNDPFVGRATQITATGVSDGSPGLARHMSRSLSRANGFVGARRRPRA
jgi:hypothetical protein